MKVIQLTELHCSFCAGEQRRSSNISGTSKADKRILILDDLSISFGVEWCGSLLCLGNGGEINRCERRI